MKINTAVRHLREGGKNVVRNGWMSFASISSIAISLFILGVFLLLTLNVNFLAQQIEQQVEIRVYMEVNTPDDQINLLRGEIAAIPQVNKVTFVSKEEGLVFLREKLGEGGNQLLEGFEGENNPLNDSFTIEVAEPRQVADVAQQINSLNNDKPAKPIQRVSYGQGTVETMFKITSIVRNIGLAIVAGLALTAMFLIANTIKLTILARRREISIMKLVGATNAFIRWPFFIEGALLGIIGSVIPVVILLYGYWQMMRSIHLDLNLMLIELLPFESIRWETAGLLIGIGVLIGIWGSTLSVRKFLKV
ncbi:MULTISPECIES: permease-like cell division protein FtsX [unclassified Paenibacillus]|uniref:permease-like cell division protein FtsX n=1 Tax=unclassified Paenibacillus TaxID=185978 RepID=UPI001AE821B8|nr:MULTISPECIES: permease-like cell division protein FtsX [unclassified Paenibacillus]MBP1157770.1 cell division transport system permease protein [Paenibacillus sp. PvP091]MBP1171494.1 cell division transport system permease protein [Paenibacillus sp. PvR098]MBP2442522.1 cell division transport system permease protein [Paenibacillus sp. PvP052]